MFSLISSFTQMGFAFAYLKGIYFQKTSEGEAGLGLVTLHVGGSLTLAEKGSDGHPGV